MELTPWKPFGELTPFKREMDRLWNQMFGELNGREILEAGWLPPLDLVEEEDRLVIEAELPGMEAKDIDVNLSGDLLTIKGEKKKERSEKGKSYLRTECHIGSFQRSIRLPAGVQQDRIDARFDKGVLKITLQKTAEAKQKQIKIKVH